MIQITVQGDPLPDILDDLKRFQARLDLYEVAKEISEVLYDDNRAARLEGVDKDGVRFADLADSTLSDPRRGPGPPLAPQGLLSRVVSHFDAAVSREGDSAYKIVGSWPGFDRIIGYHVTGYHHAGGGFVPARDPAGVRPEGMAKVEDVFDAYCRKAVEG